MTPPGNLKFGNDLFDLEETNIYGIFEPNGYMTWHIEMFPEGEDNYIMFNSLQFDNIFSPGKLNDIKYKADADASDLKEHTVRVNGQDRFLQSVDMTFGKWNTANQSIELTGHGTIDAEDDIPEILFKFNALLKFKEINIFETSQAAVQKFVETYLQDVQNRIEIKFENVASGLQAEIAGQF